MKEEGGEKARRKLHRLLFHFQTYFEILPSMHARSSEATILHLEKGIVGRPQSVVSSL